MYLHLVDFYIFYGQLVGKYTSPMDPIKYSQATHLISYNITMLFIHAFSLGYCRSSRSAQKALKTHAVNSTTSNKNHCTSNFH